ncbi:AdoMet_MTases domain containing protein [Caulobacteraceae bacterium]
MILPASPSSARNREPLLAVLRRWLPASGTVLEVASGLGEHAAWFAEALPGITWQPTDRNEEALDMLRARRDQAGLANLAPPLVLNAAEPDGWPLDRADAIVCINMVHISPWAATQGLMVGAARVLPVGGALILYGPYIEDGVETAPSNLAFDADLKRRDPAWGLRDLADVAALAAEHGLSLAGRVAMPANNLCLLFRR